MNLSNNLAKFIFNLNYQALPKPVVEKAKLCILHGVGLGLAGYDTHYAQMARDMVKRMTAGNNIKGATLLGEKEKLTPELSAFANAVQFHSRAQEDFYGALHFGPIIIPVVLAISEDLKKNGQELITALVIGYEVALALAKDFVKYSSSRGFRGTANYGIFGAVAAACKLMGLTEKQIVSAFGYASAFAFGNSHSLLAGTPEWRFQAGMAAMNGIMAAKLAQTGDGAETALVGKAGFYPSFAGVADLQEDKITDNLGKEYEILKIGFKPYPGNIYVQTPILSVQKMLTQHQILAEDIEKVIIYMHPQETVFPGITFQGPFTKEGQSILSVPYCVALVCLRKELKWQDYVNYQEKKVNELATRITVESAADINPFSCRVEFLLKNGSMFNFEMKISSMYYDFEPDEEVKVITRILQEFTLDFSYVEKVIKLPEIILTSDNIFGLLSQLALNK